MGNALGIAFNQMSGSYQMAVGASTHLRAMQAGFSGQASVLAVELTRRGIVGSRQCLEGRYGLFRTYIRTGSPISNSCSEGWGTGFRLLDCRIVKIWPACGHCRPVNAAIDELRRDQVCARTRSRLSR